MTEDEILQSLLDKYPQTAIRKMLIRQVSAPCEARALIKFLTTEGYRHIDDLNNISKDIKALCDKFGIKFIPAVQRTFTKP